MREKSRRGGGRTIKANRENCLYRLVRPYQLDFVELRDTLPTQGSLVYEYAERSIT